MRHVARSKLMFVFPPRDRLQGLMGQIMNEDMKLTNVFIFQLMCQTNSLWLMFHRLAINNG